MIIENLETVKQAIANVELEGLTVSQEVKDLLYQPNITTEEILDFIRQS